MRYPRFGSGRPGGQGTHPLRRTLTVGAIVTLSLSVLVLPGTAGASVAAGTSRPTVVVAGLNNPRQIVLGWDAALYVAEAGRGGRACEGPPGEEICVGLTASISRVARPWRTSDSSPVRIVRGLPSGAGKDGSFAVGVDGVGVRGQSLFAIETFAPPDVLPGGAPYRFMGKLLESVAGGPLRIRADISAAEFALNPDGGEIDTNPYAVLPLRDRILVADAAANAVFQVRGSRVSVWAVFPDDAATGAQFVPTSLALGPDGHVYVGGLGGEVPGVGKVVKLTQNGVKVRTWRGFNSVTGVAVDHEGTLYVSELFANASDDPAAPPPGQLTVVRDGHRHSMPVPFPAGVAVSPKGAVYVAAWSIAPASGAFGGGRATSGQVWRFDHH